MSISELHSAPPAGLRNVEPGPRDRALRWPFWDLGRSRYGAGNQEQWPLPCLLLLVLLVVEFIARVWFKSSED